MRRLHALFLLATLCSLGALESNSGNYSIDPPGGWTARHDTGMKEVVFFHPQSQHGFRPNMVFIEEGMGRTTSLEQAVDSSIELMQAKMPGFKLTGRSKLTGQSGLVISKITYHGELFPGKPPMNNVCYQAVVGKGRLLSITVSGTGQTPKDTYTEAEAAVLTLRSL